MPIETREFEYDNLLGGGVQPIVAKGNILQGTGVYKRGTVLALVSVTNGIETLTPVTSGGAGALSDPYAVLADVELDTTNGAQSCAVYLSGEFAANGLIFQGSDTVDDFVSAMREKGMIVKTTI